MNSVVQDWAASLPLMMQSVLLSACRGWDGETKEGPTKQITRWIRVTVQKDALAGKNKRGHSFMDIGPVDFDKACDNFWGNCDHLHLHFVLHTLHAAEIIGYKHPDPDVANKWLSFYFYGCKVMHVRPETSWELDQRLDESNYPA